MPPIDNAAREQLFGELDKTFFVEASAGTGKTHELVRRIVALVARGRLGIEGLAAITFTEAAAAELRDRVRRELAQAALDEGKWPDAVQRERCLEASRAVDLAQIQTIHAFAGGLLRAFPLEANLPPGFEIWDEMQRDRDFDERFRGWLYDEVPSDEDPARRAAVTRLLDLGLPPDKLHLLATKLQEQYDLLQPGQTWEVEAVPDLVEAANRLGQRFAEVEAMLAYSKLGDADPLFNQVRGAVFSAERLRLAETEREAREALLRYLSRMPSTGRGAQGDWERLPDGTNAAKAVKDTLKDLAAEVTVTVEQHRGAALADVLGHLARFTLNYAVERRERGVATFHDLLVWARDLLRDHAEVRRRAHQRIERLFVDEFQDTDPLQAELIVYLSADPAWAEDRDWEALLSRLAPGKLFVVGDPKQSIYRFRRADVAVYQRVYRASAQPEAAQAALVQTFRTVQPITHWVNAHFVSEMRHEAGVQATYAELAPRDALPGAALDLAACGVRTIGGITEDKSGERWRKEAEHIARVAAKAVAEGWPVSEQVDGQWSIRPVRYRDICVLLPTRTNLRRLERAFSDFGVPYRMESGSLVLVTQEVRDLIAAARSIEDPSDQVALVAVLRSPAYACSDVDLLAWAEAGGWLSYLGAVPDIAGPVGPALASLRRFHEARTERSAAATLEAFIDDRLLALGALAHPRAREVFRRQRYLVAQARKLAASGDSTLRGFVYWIEQLRQNEPYQAESAVPDSDEDAVRFMTVHGSKGLEFPVVILSGLGSELRRPNDGVQLLATRLTGRIEARCVGSQKADFKTLAFNKEAEQGLDEAEKLRLLYVAATRAREHLVLCLTHHATAGAKSHAAAILRVLPSVREPRPREIGLADLMATARPTVLPEAEVVLLTPEAHQASEEQWLAARAAQLANLARERVFTPSGLGHEPVSAAPSVEEDTAPAPRQPRGGGTTLGNAVHAVMQWLDLETLTNLDSLAVWAAGEQGVSPETVAHLVRRAAESAPVRAAVTSGRYWREVPVGIEIDGALLEGAIDLLYEDGEALVVADYKTDRVPAAALHRRSDQYRLQGEAYALAVSQATGRKVSRVELIFASVTDSDGAVVFTIERPEAERVLAAIGGAQLTIG